jgi:lysozyme
VRTSPQGIAAIKRFEGCVPHTYLDSGGVKTIGYGHTGPEVTDGLEWTQQQCDQQLAKDLGRFERCVEEAIAQPLSQGQFDALVSLAFNIGEKAFRTSTLARLFNAGATYEAGLQFVRWHKDNGQPNRVLLERRAAELWMFARASK